MHSRTGCRIKLPGIRELDMGYGENKSAQAAAHFLIASIDNTDYVPCDAR